MTIRVRECEVVYKTRSYELNSRVVTCARDVYRLVPELLNRAHESMVVVMLDVKKRVVGKAEVARGGGTGAGIDTGSVFRAALLVGASAIILVHNHPSGETSPSDEDIALTENLVKAGKILSVPVLDHVIVSDRGYCSLLDLGTMPSAV